MSSPVKNKKELIDLLVYNQAQIKSFGVKRLGVFGSFVRDEVNDNSDVDLFIDFSLEYKSLKNFVSLYNYMKNILGREVEIVTPQSLNKFIGKYIIQEVEYVAFAA
jgi:predicted nucleotidyltransferase